MSFYAFLTALVIFALIAVAVLIYFRVFTRLVIEIVDNRHSFGYNGEVNYVQNAILFAYKPLVAEGAAANSGLDEIVTEQGANSANPLVVAAPHRPFLGILGSPANEFAAKFGCKVIALSRHVWRPPPTAADKGKKSNDDSEYEDNNPELPEISAIGEEIDITKDALSAMNYGDSRYIVGVVISESNDETKLIYPSPLCEQLRAHGFTKFCILPPLQSALRLRYAAGRHWRKNAVNRIATAIAGVRFSGSSREVIRQYRLKPPRSPVIIELYDATSASFFLPLADDLDAGTSRHLTMRLPAELTCPRPPPVPLPASGGLLGSPPAPYKNMNAIYNPWDPYANEEPSEESKTKVSKHDMERA